MNHIDVMKQALEALQAVYLGERDTAHYTAITALRTAIEEAGKVELHGVTQVSKVWWDGDKLVAQAIPLSDIYTTPPAAPVQEPVTGCACRWDHEDNRMVTCQRHQGWLEVIVEWADRAREAEAKLKAASRVPDSFYVLSPECAERGCMGHDTRVDGPGVVIGHRDWIGLTDEEMRELEKQFEAERVRTSDEEYLVIYPSDYWRWQRAIEAKLKEKNNG